MEVLKSFDNLSDYKVDDDLLDNYGDKSLYDVFRNFVNPNKGFAIANTKTAPMGGEKGNELWMDDDFIAIPYSKLDYVKNL